MKRHKFQLRVIQNPGKVLNMTYDKRQIVMPSFDLSDVRVVETIPFGHKDLTVENTWKTKCLFFHIFLLTIHCIGFPYFLTPLLLR